MMNLTGPALLAMAMLQAGGISAHVTLDVEMRHARPGNRSDMGRSDTVSRSGERADTVSTERPQRDTVPITTVDAAVHTPPWRQAFDLRSKSNRLGFFLNEQQIEAMHPQYTSDALRRVPGVVVLPSRGIGNVVHIRDCSPLIWVDGQRAPGVELDEVTHGSDVAALEVYRSLAGVPAEFTDRTATCGTILVWMKSD